jgi:hypothetical protein
MMKDVEIRPATKEDFLAFGDGAYPAYRVKKAIAGLYKGELLALGGIAIRPDAIRIGFLDCKPAARQFPIALTRTAKQILAECKAEGVRRICATMDENIARAPAWALRLGFRPVQANGITVWIWEHHPEAAKPTEDPD